MFSMLVESKLVDMNSGRRDVNILDMMHASEAYSLYLETILENR